MSSLPVPGLAGAQLSVGELRSPCLHSEPSPYFPNSTFMHLKDFFMCVCVYMHMCVCGGGYLGVQEKVLDPLELES